MSDNEETNSKQQLAKHRTDLAEKRTVYARSRTFQAAERTYSAWVRTGFSITGAGVALGQLLQDTRGQNLALIIGGTLVFIGVVTFVYAWIEYRATFKYIKESILATEEDVQPLKLNFVTVTIITIGLLIACVLGFWLMVF